MRNADRQIAKREGVVGVNARAWQWVCRYRTGVPSIDGVQVVELVVTAMRRLDLLFALQSPWGCLWFVGGRVRAKEGFSGQTLWPLPRGYPASGRPVKPDSRRENQRANWNSTQRLANMRGACRSERIQAAAEWEIRDKEV